MVVLWTSAYKQAKKKRLRTMFSLLLLAISIVIICLAMSSGNGAASSTFTLLTFCLFSAIIGLSALLTKPRPGYDLLSDYWGARIKEWRADYHRTEGAGRLGVDDCIYVPRIQQCLAIDGAPAKPLEWWR